jgi:stage VI sporulation protein D
MGPGNQLGTSSDQEPLILSGQSLADGQWDEENTASVYEVKDQLQVQPVAQTQQTGPGEDEEQNMLAAQPQQAQQIQEVLAAPSSDEEPEGAPSPHEQVRQVFVEQPVQQEQEVNAEQHAEEAQEVFAEQAPDVEEALAAQEVFADRPAEDAPEMKVAISGKQNEQSDAKVNITSLFTQPRRLQPQQPPSDEETSSSSSRKVMAGAGRSEAVSNLTSFVRQTEERMSKVRIAILQRNETIEAIAERYHIPVSRIMEVNKVSSDRIAEGQILYIPQ